MGSFLTILSLVYLFMKSIPHVMHQQCPFRYTKLRLAMPVRARVGHVQMHMWKQLHLQTGCVWTRQTSGNSNFMRFLCTQIPQSLNARNPGVTFQLSLCALGYHLIKASGFTLFQKTDNPGYESEHASYIRVLRA